MLSLAAEGLAYALRLHSLGVGEGADDDVDERELPGDRAAIKLSERIVRKDYHDVAACAARLHTVSSSALSLLLLQCSQWQTVHSVAEPKWCDRL